MTPSLAILSLLFAQEDLSKARWLPATAYVVPKETATEGEGYFSIIEGQNGRLYIGTHANAVNSWLVEFDPATQQDEGRRRLPTRRSARTSRASAARPRSTPATTSAPAARSTSAPSRATPTQEARSARTTPAATRWSTTRRPARRRSTRSRCRTRASTASRPTSRAASPTSRPAPTTGPAPARTRTSSILDLKTGKYREPDRHEARLRLHRRRLPGPGVSPDARRRHRPLRPEDGQARAAEADDRRQAADEGVAPGRPRSGHPINWDISPDGKTLYSLPMSTNQLYAYDLTQTGDTLAGKSLGDAGAGGEGHRLPGDVRRAEGHGVGGDHRGAPEGRPPAAPGQLPARRQGAARPRPGVGQQPRLHRVRRQGRQAAAVPRRLRQVSAA